MDEELDPMRGQLVQIDKTSYNLLTFYMLFIVFSPVLYQWPTWWRDNILWDLKGSWAPSVAVNAMPFTMEGSVPFIVLCFFVSKNCKAVITLIIFDRKKAHHAELFFLSKQQTWHRNPTDPIISQLSVLGAASVRCLMDLALCHGFQ